MTSSNRLAWIGAIALAVILLLTLTLAPTTNSKINNGSTYSRNPEGYGAWYAYMKQQGNRIERLQKPFYDLKQTRPITLLQVYSYQRPPGLFGDEKKWVEKGNTLVILGVSDRATAAEFTTMQESPFGKVKIETRRRRRLEANEKLALGDRFGAIVWEEKHGQGTAIFAITPYLGANAYQDYLSNFQYLSNLLSKKANQIFVDEYIHGYKEASVRKAEGKGDIWSYFGKTPLILVLIQVSVLVLVLVWGQNRRFGKTVTLDTPVINNSEAYIQALAEVLQKAESSDFVVQMIGKEEQLQLQKALGLGQQLLDCQTLINAWVQQTGTSAAVLDEVLKQQSQKRRFSERELLSWLEKWQALKQVRRW
jgi:Domain of unknown function (DUF4350)